MAQVFDIIEKLNSSGELSLLYKEGLISQSVYRYYQIERDKRYMTARFKRKTKGRIVAELCEKHAISIQLIYKASDIMNRQL